MGRYFENQTINDIINRIDIVDIVSENVKLTRRGNRYWGICPFHEEKTSSFSVTPDKNLFYCFGCHAGGNVFTYLMKRDGIDFPEAVEILAAKAGVQLVAARNSKTDDVRKKVIEINNAAAMYYNQLLLNGEHPQAQEYVINRGLNRQIIEEFTIGYAPNQWNALEEFLLKKGYPEKYIKMSGLIRRSSSGDKYFDLFRNRILFPIKQYNGEILGFGGRVMDDSLPKYLNTPETEIFSKRKNLYGLYQAREAIRRENLAILVEGYMDCVKIHQNQIKNAVASLGTAFTSDQAALLKRYTEKVLMLYDADEAGQRETMRAIDILRGQGLEVEVVTLAGGKDPDEFLRMYGKEEFLYYIQNNKISFIEFKINKYINQEKVINFEAQKSIINAVKNDISSLNSQLEKDRYIKILAQKLRLEENLVYREISSKKRDIHLEGGNKSQKYRDNIKYGNYSLEEKILAAMIRNNAVYEKIKSSIGINFFSKQAYKDFIRIYDDVRNLQGMYNIEDIDLNQTLARIEFMLEDIPEINAVLINNFIRNVKLLKSKKRKQAIFDRINILSTEGDFDNLMNFILELDSILNQTREGGIK